MLLLLFILVFAATIFFPGPMIAVIAINTGVVLLISALQIAIILFPSFEPPRKKLTRHPFISVLVPSHNEPPALLMQTLEALATVDYENYEVLVIDNNTKDPAIWRPIEEFCKVLGGRFRFFHVEDLSGFKAGALNYALGRVSPACEYVAVIDADYIVNTGFLALAASHFTAPDIALVQFPQEYRNVTAHNQPIADEYRHFFKIYMNMANHLDCVPSTGTVSVYSAPALFAIGKFRSQTLTEDADAGLRLYKAGYRGVYVETQVGYGLMPYDIEAYRKQKRRWALGNAQSLGTLFSLYGKIPLRSWVGFLSHLTAWDHLNFLPFAVLAGYALVVTPVIPTTPTHQLLLDISSLSIFTMLASRFLLFLATFRGQERATSRALKAFIIHIGMTFLYSEALFELLFKRSSKFERTNKFVLSSVPNLLKNTHKELILGAWFLVGAAETFAFGGRLITFSAFTISAFALLSVYYVYWRILPTKEYSKQLIDKAQERYRAHLPEASALPQTL